MADPSATVRSSTRQLQRVALVAFGLLFALTLAWEGWLAPKGPPGLWLAVKTIPLLVPVFGLLRGRPRSYIHAALIVLLYLTEGLVILWVELGATGRSGAVTILAGLEVILSLTGFTSAVYYVRQRRASGATLDG